MLNKLLNIVAPHYCYGCHKTGVPLCDNCKYDIIDEAFDACIVCASPSSVGICAECRTSYQKAWFVGDRSGVLEATIDALKFERVKSAADSLASLLDNRLPVLPTDTVIVPIPTLPSHIRRRGYDQTLLIAKRLATYRKLQCDQVLERRMHNVQRGANKKERFKQAERAFGVRRKIDPNVPYVLIDDVVTTNATVRFGAQALLDAGAKTVWVTAIARQPLDKSV